MVGNKWENKQYVLNRIKEDGYNFQYASPELQDNEEVLISAMKNTSGRAIKYASPRLRDNEKLITEAVTSSGYNLQYASDRLRDNEEIAMIAIKNSYGQALADVSPRLNIYCYFYVFFCELYFR